MGVEDKIEEIKEHIKSYPDFPKEGILFRDIFSVLAEPRVFRLLCEVMVERVRSLEPPVDAIVGLDSRGFLLGPPICLELGLPFYPVRKKGKLPGKIQAVTYQLEYGEDVFEIQDGVIKNGARVVIVDDLIATGGSLVAANKLVEKVGGTVVECLAVIELVDLKGRDKVSNNVHSLVKY